MSEMERLKERLAGARNFSVSWGPEAHKMTAEQRAAEINKALDSLEAGDYEDVTDFDEETIDPDARINRRRP